MSAIILPRCLDPPSDVKMEAEMRVAVFGTGGVGGYFGGKLAQAGEDVAFIARGAHLEAMKTEGLRVDSLKGDFRLSPLQAYGSTEEVGPVDVVILGVKTWQVPEAASTLMPLMREATFV